MVLSEAQFILTLTTACEAAVPNEPIWELYFAGRWGRRAPSRRRRTAVNLPRFPNADPRPNHGLLVSAFKRVECGDTPRAG